MKVNFYPDKAGPAIYKILVKGCSKSRLAIYRFYLVIRRAARDAGVSVSILKIRSNESINIPYKNKTISIRKTSLAAVVSDDHYVDLHIDSGPLRLHMTFSSICALLDKEQFIEINRGVILNMARISAREKDFYVMDNGERFAIRVNNRKAVTKKIEAYRLKVTSDGRLPDI